MPLTAGQHHALELCAACVCSQVLSLVDYPDLLKNKTALCAYPDDAVARAKAYIAGIPGGTGVWMGVAAPVCACVRAPCV